MHDILDTILNITGNYFWFLLGLGPVSFLVALPRILEYRRRDLDPVYRKQREAYGSFMKYPEDDIRKWNSLKELIAVSYKVEPGSWTIGDSREHLPKAGIDGETVALICKCHEITDTDDYATGKTCRDLPMLKDVGQKLFKSLQKLSLVLFAGFLLLPTESRAQDWDAANSAFEEAAQMEPGSVEYFTAFSKAALQYEAIAGNGERAGIAWYNAGNAWFFAGEIGRSIACYKHAVVHRPFDPLVKKNLVAARALAVDVVETNDRPVWLSWPIRWIGLLTILFSFTFWGLLLAYFRYRNRPLLSLTGATLLVILILGSLALYSMIIRNQQGVVIVPEVYGRKGPGYNYLTAFHEPLHDGLEFEVVQTHKDWLMIMLTDGRECWIPASQAGLIDLSL